MKKNPYEYEDNCSRERVEELYDNVSPLEGFPDELTKEMFVEWEMKNASARYAVLCDGRLAGICFVYDKDVMREMVFTKTQYLTTSRRITFARTIGILLSDLHKKEIKRIGKTGVASMPMYMHTPEGDERSEEWFIRSGCVKTKYGLLCPN